MEKINCKCASGTPFRTIDERGPADDSNVYPWDIDGPNPSRSGHQPGCPCDVVTYSPGEWYTDCSKEWAENVLIPKSNRLLRIGTPKNISEEKTKSSTAVVISHKNVGLYRQ